MTISPIQPAINHTHSGAADEETHQSQNAGAKANSEISLESYEGWQSFELLPPSYRNAREARSVLTAWMIVATFLFAFFVGSIVALFLRGRATRQRNAELVATAQPLRNLKSEVALIHRRDQLIRKWNQLVESARPDDSLLQVLASVAHATHPTENGEPEDHLDVQAIHAKLALEHSSSAEKAPTWAQPKLSLSALANRRAAVTQWSGRLSALDRLTEVETNSPSSFFRQTLVQATAVPRATRVLP